MLKNLIIQNNLASPTPTFGKKVELVFYSARMLLSKVNPHGRPNNHLIVENIKLLRLCGNYVIQTAPNLKLRKKSKL